MAWRICGDEEIREVADVIKSGKLTIASRCANFTEDLAGCIGARHVLGVNSTTAALHLGLEALGKRQAISSCFGDAIWIPPQYDGFHLRGRQGRDYADPPATAPPASRCEALRAGTNLH